MGGRLPLDYDVEKAKAELKLQLTLDTASYQIFAKQQSNGRGLRGGIQQGTLNCIVAGRRTGKSNMFTVDHSTGNTTPEKFEENTDTKQADIDYIGELIIDTRNYDIDEENVGVVVLDSSVISLTGGITTELRFKDSLSSENIPKLLGIDKLDECEVDIGVFRYVFGFTEGATLISDFTHPAIDSNHPQLISKHKYPYSDEEFIDKEYADA